MVKAPGRIVLLALVLGCALITGCAVGDSGAAAGLSGVGPAETIDITGATAPGGRELRPIAFRVHAPWMDGHLLMRFPETLRTSMGLHFIDHHRADMPPLSEIDPLPEWRRDERSGALYYNCRTPEGVEFTGRAEPRGDAVDLEFRVANRTDRELRHAGAQMCLTLSKCRDFAEKNQVETTFTWVDGEFTSLAETTPTPREMGRSPWLLMFTKGASYGGPRSHPDGWWVVDQRADRPVIARRSSDGDRLLAIWWRGAHSIMTNTTIPCIHSRLGRKNIAPGQEVVWRGRIYLMPDRPDRLLRRWRQDSGGQGPS